MNVPNPVIRFVPQRGWTRGFRITASGVRSSPISIAWTTWCSAAWKPVTQEKRKSSPKKSRERRPYGQCASQARGASARRGKERPEAIEEKLDRAREVRRELERAPRGQELQHADIDPGREETEIPHPGPDRAARQVDPQRRRQSADARRPQLPAHRAQQARGADHPDVATEVIEDGSRVALVLPQRLPARDPASPAPAGRAGRSTSRCAPGGRAPAPLPAPVRADFSSATETMPTIRPSSATGTAPADETRIASAARAMLSSGRMGGTRRRDVADDQGGARGVFSPLEKRGAVCYHRRTKGDRP